MGTVYGNVNVLAFVGDVWGYKAALADSLQFGPFQLLVSISAPITRISVGVLRIICVEFGLLAY